MTDDFNEDFYVIREHGCEPELGLGHRGEDNQEIIPPGQSLPRKQGRPTAYDPRYPAMVREMCKRGMTDFDLAEVLGVHRATIFRWRAEYPEFNEATKLGKEHANQRVEQALYDRCLGYDMRTEKLFSFEGNISRAEVIEHIPADPKCMMYWLQNRMPAEWKNVQQITGANGQPLIPSGTPTTMELARFFALTVTRAAEAGDETQDSEETGNG